MTYKLLLMSKMNQTADGRKFRKFFTSMNIVVKGEEEKGLQQKTLNVKFDEKVNTKDFVRGIVQVDENKIEIPYKWEVKEDTKTGKKRFPTIWIKEIVMYTPKLAKSTGTFNLLDEEETDEVVISEEQ